MSKFLIALFSIIFLNFLSGSVLSSCKSVKNEQKTEIKDSFEVFAMKIDSSINSRDASFFNDNFDKQSLINTILMGLEVDPLLKGDFSMGMANGFSIGDEIVGSIDSFGSYKLVKFEKTSSDKAEAVYRMLTPYGSNYHKLYFYKDGNTIKTYNIYLYLALEFISDMLRRNFIINTMTRGADSIGGFKGEEAIVFNNFNLLKDLLNSINYGETNVTRQVLDSLPTAFKETQFGLITQLNFYQYTRNYKELDNIISKIKAKYPDTYDYLSLILFDYYSSVGKFDEAKEVLEKMKTKIANDPYLDILESDIYIQKGEFDVAEKMIKSFVKDNPDITQGKVALTSYYIRKKDFKQAAAQLDDLYTLKFNIKEWVKLESLAEFRNSAEYKKWESKN